METVTTPPADLLDRLAAHKTLGAVPRAELEWLIAHSEFRRYALGDVIARKGEPAAEMLVVFSGRAAVRFEQGTGRRHVMESKAGGVTGMLPFSRMGAPLGDAIAEEPTEALVMQREQMPGLIRECPTITATLVHVMIDRARQFTAINWQDEKMVSLGRLAAGLAHELNNPASAATSSARRLSGALVELGDAAAGLGRSGLSEEQRARVAGFLGGCLGAPVSAGWSAMESSDREDKVINWLEAHGADAAHSQALAESGASAESLEDLSRGIPAASLEAVLRWAAAACSAQSLATDVERATGRISKLVSAVKRFTFMDRAAVAAPTDIAQGLADTVAVLAAKARDRRVVVRIEVAGNLPPVPGSTADLNQVWMNLIDNALDALQASGEVTVRATQEGGVVVVRVIDDGAGIAPELVPRIFDPFFTTKGVGEGSGLGLDIARRIVRMHEGQIEVESRPGRTEFRVRIPVATPSVDGAPATPAGRRP